jgi:hypothetical protein
MDNDFSSDLRELTSAMATNDVVTMRFVTVGQRLLFDFRSNGVDGPVVRIVEPVRSVRERYESLRQLRPRFDVPDRIVAISWPRFARSLGASEPWAEAMTRLADSGDAAAVRAAEAALARLAELEAVHQRAAIRGGDAFRTLWSTRTAHR